MNKTIRVVAVAALALMLGMPAFAAVTATPSTVTFNNHQESAVVTLTRDGQTVAPGAVSGVRFMVENSNYSHMISVSATSEGLRIEPTALLERGSYDLIANTNQGEVRVRVYAPLADLQSILDAADGPGGQGRAALRRELGFTSETGRATVSITLPPVMLLGQTLALDMDHDPNREYIWAINGEIVQQGRGESSLRYPLTQTGDHILTYAERLDGAVVAYAEAITRVTEHPAELHPVGRGASPVFEGPEGYAEYHWHVDGELRGDGRTFTMVFDQPGEYIVTVHATQPGQPPRIIRYRAIVE